MVRRLGGLMLLGLIVTLVAAACGGDDATPTPIIIEKEVIKEVEVQVEVEKEVIREVEVEKAVVREVIKEVQVTPTPTPGPTATPTTDPATLTANFRIMASSGYASFIEGYREALSRATGDRITLTPEEATGDDAVNFTRSRPEEARKTMFTLTEEQATMWQEGGINFNGELSFEKRPSLIFAVYPAACMTIQTLDPEIKTVYDLDGKRMHLWNNSGGSAAWYANMIMVMRAAGIYDTTTLLTGGKYPTTALADREVDATTMGIVFADSRKASSGASAHRLAQATGTYQLVDIPLEVIEAVRADPANKAWVDAGTLEPVKLEAGWARGAYGTDYNVIPDGGIYCLSGNGVHWGISPDADAEEIYQFTSAIFEHRVDIANTYFPFLMPQLADRIGHIWAPQENFHPGAVRAFEEFGLTFGTPGIREWEAAHPDGRID